MSGGSVDVIQQFSVVGGDALLADTNFNTVEVQAATHREIWFGFDEGQFTDQKVREAFALSIDRQELIDTLFSGKATIANDHVIFDLYPFHDPDAVTQRERDKSFPHPDLITEKRTAEFVDSRPKAANGRCLM